MFLVRNPSFTRHKVRQQDFAQYVCYYPLIRCFMWNLQASACLTGHTSSILCSINSGQEDLNTTWFITTGWGLTNSGLKQYFESSNLVEGSSRQTGSVVSYPPLPFIERSVFSPITPVLIPWEVGSPLVHTLVQRLHWYRPAFSNEGWYAHNEGNNMESLSLEFPWSSGLASQFPSFLLSTGICFFSTSVGAG